MKWLYAVALFALIAASVFLGGAYTYIVQAQLIAHQSPIVDAGPDKNAQVHQEIQLSGTATDDGMIVGMQWQAPATPCVLGQSVLERFETSGAADSDSLRTSITCSVAGVYDVRLTAVDNAGKSAFDTLQITITASNAGSATAFCGNSVAEGDEQCDGADMKSVSCVALGFTSGTLRCTDLCLFDTSLCIFQAAGDATEQPPSTTTEAEPNDPDGAICGNGKLEDGEECDQSLVRDKACTDFGYDGGVLRCSTA